MSMSDTPRPFKMVQRFLKAKPLSKQLSMAAFVLHNASAILMATTGMDMRTLATLASPLPANPNRISPDDPYPPPEPGSCPWPAYNCKVCDL